MNKRLPFIMSHKGVLNDIYAGIYVETTKNAMKLENQKKADRFNMRVNKCEYPMESPSTKPFE